MPSILDYLNTISDARYGRDVRQAIVDAISACYQDGRAGVSDLEARRLIESAIGVNESQQADIDTLYAQIADIQGGGGDSSQESTTITLDTVIYDGGFVDSVTVNNNATKTYDVTFTQTFTEVPEVFACVAVQNSAAASYSKVTVGIVKAQTTTTGFRFFIANTSGATRSTTVVWAAFQPTTKEIDLDITIPSGDGMSEADVLAITNPIQTALNGVKTGYDGTEYSTPGEAVRTQINDLHVLLTQLPFADVTAEADMTDTARIYRYDGALWFYDGTEWAKVGTGSGAGGAVVVTEAADMTDHSLIYLYEGTEADYTAGHFYYYNGTAWVDGGLYYVGRDGARGTNGQDGQDGVDGADGQDGQDGFSPVATVETTSTGVRISITDKNGTTSATVQNGTATDAQVADWLDNHPEATTTVEDGAISNSKLASGIYGRLKTADYGALKRLLSAMLYDTDIESAENVASLINSIIGDKDLGDFMLPDYSANNVRPIAIYSDDGETELYSAASPKDSVFWNNAESVQTEYHITIRTTTGREWPVYIGEYDPTNKQLNNAVLFGDSFTKSITYSADYTVASGKQLGVVCIGGTLGFGGTKGHGGTYESLTIYKKIV